MINKTLLALGFLPLLATKAFAPPPPPPPPSSAGIISTAMLGIAIEFGKAGAGPDIGFTGKVLMTDQSSNLAAGFGLSYFPWADEQKFGLDLNAGLVLDNAAILGGYDLLRQQLQVSGGWVPTIETRPIPR